MFLVPAIIFGIQTSFSLEAANLAAQSRNEGILAAMSVPELSSSRAFRFLNSSGAYGGGQDGWTAHPLRQPNGPREYVVFSTPIVCEDIGEQVFELSGGKIVRKWDEMESAGLQAKQLNVTIQFQPEKSLAEFVAEVHYEQSSAAKGTVFQVRLAPNFTMKRVERNGRQVTFSQAGGVVLVPMMPREAGNSTYTYHYTGKFDNRSIEGRVNKSGGMLAGAAWWPSLNRQASAIKTTMVTPKDWVAIGHGNRISETVKGEEKTTIWDCRRPICVFSAAAGPYKWVEKKIGNKNYWIASRNLTEGQANAQIDANHQVLKFLDTLYPSPFDNYGSLVSPQFFGGALEAYSFATYLEGWLPAVEPHEVSHSLFGGMIPNTYMKSLWNESFASFFEKYYQREGVSGNREELRLAFREMGSINDAFSAWPAISAGCETGGFASPIGYDRGGRVLSMLEQEMGPDAFRKAVKSWLNKHQPGEVGEWEDFIAVVGSEYTWFFDQWLRRAGFADFEAKNVRFEEGNLKGTLQFKGQPYRLKIEVLIEFADGLRQWETVTVQGQSTEIAVPLSQKPIRVVFDPWNRILRRISPREIPGPLAAGLRGRLILNGPGADTSISSLLRFRSQNVTEWPADVNDRVLIGNPVTDAQFAQLLSKIPNGPVLGKDSFTWRGQTIRYDQGGYLGVLPGTGAVIGFGHVRLRPLAGAADEVAFDDLGQPKAAVSSPRTQGSLTFVL